MEALAKPVGELTLYFSFADKISKGLTPYVDFFPEYPPFALHLFSLANIFGEMWFTLIFYLMVALAVLGMMIMIKKLKGNPYIFLCCILPLGGLLWDRYDIFASYFTLLSIYLAKKRNLLSIFALIAGIMTKIYPIVILPIILGMFMFQGKFWKATLLFIIGMLMCILPQKKFIDVLFKYHGNRGIQIESIKATPLLFQDSIVEWGHGTYEIRK